MAGLRTRAVRDGDEWVINGTKLYITNGTQADWLCLLARTSDEGGYRGMSQIVRPDRRRRVLGEPQARQARASARRDTAELSFVDVRVPVANTIGEIGRGFQQQMAQFQNERMIAGVHGASAPCAGALDRTVDYLQAAPGLRPAAGRQPVHPVHAWPSWSPRSTCSAHYNYACAEAIVRGADSWHHRDRHDRQAQDAAACNREVADIVPAVPRRRRLHGGDVDGPLLPRHPPARRSAAAPTRSCCGSSPSSKESADDMGVARCIASAIALGAATVAIGCSVPAERSSCDLSDGTITPRSPDASDPTGIEVARMSTTASYLDAPDPKTVLVVRSDGSIDAMGSSTSEGDGMRHATLDDEAIRGLLQCAADSGFVALTEKSFFAANGAASSDKFCAIDDAQTTTMAVRAPNGELRTSSAEAIETTSPDCHIFRPQQIVTMYAVLDQLRTQAAEIGTP